jgi:hypothetical protein
MRNFGVKVRLLEEQCYGYIVRRLNAVTYEIITEDDRLFTLSPDEFKELEPENENE